MSLARVEVACLWKEIVRFAAVDDDMVMTFEPRYVLPATENVVAGLVVPMPTLPLLEIVILVVIKSCPSAFV